MKRIVAGLTATGKLTLGNYIGAIKNLKQEQLNNEVYIFVADLHALTLPIKPEVLKANVKENLKVYLAAGIDPSKAKLFVQSEIDGHTELFYYLLTNSYMGQLERMTQYKDKSRSGAIKLANKTTAIPAGIFTYPVLMAADIILYDADGVIVGDDQKQHLELTRDLVQRINSTYGLNFKEPEPIINKVGARVFSLKDPTKKMSKSDSKVDNVIFILDEPEVIKKKIMSSVTDSENKVKYDVENKPGVSNLLTIYSSLEEITIKEAEAKLGNMEYKEFKETVAEVIIKHLKPIQEKYKQITDEDIRKSLDQNKDEIQAVANNNLDKIKKGVGIC